MRFVLEETSWTWDGSDRDAYIERIEQFLDRLDVARERDEPYAASSELLRQQVLGTNELSELLWNQDLPLNLPPEVSQRIAALFNSLPYWDEEMDWPAIEVSITNHVAMSPSTALAHKRVTEGSATACIPLPGTFRGRCEVVVDGRSAQVHFVVDEASHREFFRDAFDVERPNEAGLEALASHAYPDLFFLDGVWGELRHFEGGYARVRDSLHRLLAVLDDYGAWVFTDETGRLSPHEPMLDNEPSKPVTDQLIQQRLIGWGFDVAPEKPNVRDDGVCRRARERVLESRTLYCEWHYKFGYVNRVHIHPPVTESKDKLIVAIFRDHLPLPGRY
ncbi:hypothetical protein JQX13_17890 [Archangium violaceum]|uniref:hypothetical protein n=1 Tax=Archangium violaceum TaxID=83451 RepID=UPI00193C34BC|nr:hypothetical protein [Archangium violaceum]QRK11766.1 hypothetical protein JQX13_17890 [Archangium violaceum]